MRGPAPSRKELLRWLDRAHGVLLLIGSGRGNGVSGRVRLRALREAHLIRRVLARAGMV